MSETIEFWSEPCNKWVRLNPDEKVNIITKKNLREHEKYTYFFMMLENTHLVGREITKK